MSYESRTKPSDTANCDNLINTMHLYEGEAEYKEDFCEVCVSDLDRLDEWTETALVRYTIVIISDESWCF